MLSTQLIKRDSKGKIRVVDVWWCEQEDHTFKIHRETGCYNGKMTKQPDVIITEGKVKRTPKEQCELQYNAIVKKYTDKGYKKLDKALSTYSESDLNSLLPEETTDSNGVRKPMLAKQSEKVKRSSIDKLPYWYASRKLDGVRCMFYWDGKEVRSASRGGGDYDLSTKFLRENPKLVEWFKQNPDIVTDGELYRHGEPLWKISGAARLEQNADGMDWLEYYIYDVAIPKLVFEDRLKVLAKIQSELNLGFEPSREWKEGELRFQMVPQVKVAGYDNIMKLHNQYTSEGFEGVVCRDPSKEYGFGKRTNSMLKFKLYQDAEFKVIGKAPGLREWEDMTFICETEEGKQFRAKPMGDRETRKEYWDHFDERYKGQMATCKFFYYSEDKVPLQPIMKSFRYNYDR